MFATYAILFIICIVMAAVHAAVALANADDRYAWYAAIFAALAVVIMVLGVYQEVLQ